MFSRRILSSRLLSYPTLFPPSTTKNSLPSSSKSDKPAADTPVYGWDARLDNILLGTRANELRFSYPDYPECM